MHGTILWRNILFTLAIITSYNDRYSERHCHYCITSTIDGIVQSFHCVENITWHILLTAMIYSAILGTRCNNKNECRTIRLYCCVRGTQSNYSIQRVPPVFYHFRCVLVIYRPHPHTFYFLDLAMALGDKDPRSMTVSRSITFNCKLVDDLWTWLV